MTAAPGPLAGTGLPVTLLAVPGIKCAGCIAKLEQGLAAVPGIVAARVHFAARRIAITHQPVLDPPALVAAVAALGFEAQAIADEAAAAARESRALIKALAVAGFAAMNIMLLSVSVWSGASGATRDLFHWLSAMIGLPTILYAGQPFYRSAWGALRHRRTNMDVPIAIGITIAGALSLYETITHGEHAYFDSAVMLLFFLLSGRTLDAMMRDRARDGVAALLRQMASGALVESAAGSHWVAAADLRPGQTMLVAAGERLAADGLVSRGQSRLDCALLTGESAPQAAAPGDKVFAGTLNLDAPLAVAITAAAHDTAVADIARLMETAAQGKSRYVRIADRAARLYAPAVHALALAAFLGWLAAGAGWHQALLIAVAVLIITCPCALGLAVPAAQIVAAGRLMRAGVLVKDGTALERLAEADCAIFDKTGTLTLGRPQPRGLAGLSDDERAVALGLAQHSRHPLAEALRAALVAVGTTPAAVTEVSEAAGDGLTGRWQGQPVRLGRPVDDGAGDGAGSDAIMATALTIGAVPPVVIAFDDPIRPDTAATLAALADLGLPARILSGDRAGAVASVAAALGLPAEAGLLPADKQARLTALQAGGAHVLMVGDGLNDGPALAAGHVSLAPASASDVSRNAADAVFLGDSLAPVATAVRVARATRRIVRQNFALAIGYNVIAVPLALMGLVTPLIAALAMSGSSLIVIANALRLRSRA